MEYITQYTTELQTGEREALNGHGRQPAKQVRDGDDVNELLAEMETEDFLDFSEGGDANEIY